MAHTATACSSPGMVEEQVYSFTSKMWRAWLQMCAMLRLNSFLSTIFSPPMSLFQINTVRRGLQCLWDYLFVRKKISKEPLRFGRTSFKHTKSRFPFTCIIAWQGQPLLDSKPHAWKGSLNYHLRQKYSALATQLSVLAWYMDTKHILANWKIQKSSK